MQTTPHFSVASFTRCFWGIIIFLDKEKSRLMAVLYDSFFIFLDCNDSIYPLEVSAVSCTCLCFYSGFKMLF